MCGWQNLSLLVSVTKRLHFDPVALSRYWLAKWDAGRFRLDCALAIASIRLRPLAIIEKSQMAANGSSIGGV